MTTDIAMCNYLRVTSETAPSSDLPADPVLAVAERQLVMLGELAEMAMTMSRAYVASGVASADAAKAILAEEFFIPEVGRANACGAKDAAESFQKVTRAVRLTLKLEMTVAEAVRDLRAGIVTRAAGPKDARETPAVLQTTLDYRRPAGSCSDGRDTDATRADRDTERLVDIEYAEHLPRGFYRRLVDDLAADIRASGDWDTATLSAPHLVPPPSNLPVRRVGVLADPMAPHDDPEKGVGGGAAPPIGPVPADVAIRRRELA